MVLVILVGLGVYAWNIQYTYGLTVTGLSDVTIWGLYITNFEFLGGISAGIIITISVGYLLDTKRFMPIMKIGGILATVSVLPAMLFVAVDVGRPERILNMLLHPNLTSMLVVEFFTLSIYFIFSAMFTLVFLSEGGRTVKASFFAVLAIILAVFAHSVAAWVFSVVIARPLWHTALLVPIFLSSALVSGIALLLLVAILTSKFGELKIPPELLVVLGKALALVIPVDIFLIFTELITVEYSSTPGLLTELSTLLTGPYATVALIELGLFVVVFLPLALSKTRNSVTVLYIVSLLATVGIWMKRFYLFIPALLTSPLGTIGTYTPTLIEWQITIGLFAFGALLYSLSLKVLPFFVIDFWGTLKPSESRPQKSPIATRPSEFRGAEKETGDSNVPRRDFLKLAIGVVTGAATLASIPRSSLLLSKQEAKLQAFSVKQWAMVIDLRRCIGCQACLAACKSENGVPLGIHYTWVETHEEGKYPNMKLTFLPRLCNHCDNPPCVQVCPVGATYKRGDGIVMQDVNRCIGCRYCMVACPYGVRSFLWEEPSGAWPQAWRGVAEAKHGFVVKCHGCFHRIEKGLKPACVDACVGGARVFGDLQDPNSEVRRIVDTIPTQRLKAYLGTKPMVFYVGLSDTIAERGKKAADTIIVHQEA